jgi:hypothetical protein
MDPGMSTGWPKSLRSGSSPGALGPKARVAPFPVNALSEAVPARFALLYGCALRLRLL